MPDLDVFETANAEWTSPVVLIPKKDGSLLFCFDYRRLNKVTKRDNYPIPCMGECIDSLGDAKVFTTLDCNQGYWKVELVPEDQDKTKFRCHHGLYRFKRMPFGLKNAPGTFQRAIDIILSSVHSQHALVYLDDIIIFSSTVVAHLDHVAGVLALLNKAGMSVKLKKWFFLRSSVDYLGHVIRPGKLAVGAKTCDDVQLMQPPRNQADIKSFIGLCDVFQRFVPNCARIAALHTPMLRKEEPVKFGEGNSC